MTPTPTPATLCPSGHGYWKNRPEAWPVETLILGSQTYGKAQLLVILETPVGTTKKADASLILAYQLIAAKLNVAAGIDPAPVTERIVEADALLAAFDGRIPLRVPASTETGQNMVNVASFLESFNSGLLTPGCTIDEKSKSDVETQADALLVFSALVDPTGLLEYIYLSVTAPDPKNKSSRHRCTVLEIL